VQRVGGASSHRAQHGLLLNVPCSAALGPARKRTLSMVRHAKFLQNVPHLVN
jgi:hypothetical protein